MFGVNGRSKLIVNGRGDLEIGLRGEGERQ